MRRRCGQWCFVACTGAACVGVVAVLALMCVYEAARSAALRPGLPGAPEAPYAVMVGVDYVQISWLAPFDNGSTIVAFFVWTALQGSPLQLAWGGAQTTATVSGLAGNTSYKVAVQAENGVGKGPLGPATNITTATPRAPAEPDMPCLHDSGRQWLLVQWIPPADDGGLRISAYTLQSAGTPDGLFITCYTGLDLSFNFTGLRPAQPVVFRLCAANSFALSAWSQPLETHSEAANVSTPVAPATPLCSNATDTTIELLWEAPDDSGAPITAYTVRVVPVTQEGDTFFQTVDCGATRRSIRGLSPDSDYTLSLSAYNSEGASAYGAAATCATTAARPPSPPLPPRLAGASALWLILEWDVSNGLNVSYTLAADDWWINVSTPVPVYHGASTSYNHSDGLLPASNYTFALMAQNSVGASPWSDEVTFTTSQNGLCGNPADMATMKTHYSTMQAAIEQCLIKCAIQGFDCAVDCIHDEVGFSQKCAQCWGEMGECTLQRCATKCVIPNSEKCFDCCEKYCFPAAVACTGVPMWAFPPA
eukprot:TRINITY_DN3593_c0_g1_i4.p1 TRINITY_DN3593_c0_g1~~TRINITY_DN3593_c0_g1_i4.p1  ORF type:complete len:535 (+),score=82.30 TRINITY_DN3593_c0_g1_i4:155-1759(+)